MSILINIKQNPKKIQKIGLNFLKRWADYQKLYFGVFNQAYVIENYKGEEDIRNQLFVLYSQNIYVRGMSFIVQDNYDVEMVLNYPATKTDIEIFYKFIRDYCHNFEYEAFVQEGEVYNLDQINMLKEEAILFNQNLLKDGIEGLTIFGCIYPITLEEKFVNTLKSLSKENAHKLFEEYLDKKQKPDYYFAKPLIYDCKDKKYIARYALTENVPSIFPTYPYLPFGYDQKLKKDIKSWNIVLVKNNNESMEVVEEVPFDDFYTIINKEQYPKFDDKHIIVTLNEKILSKIIDYKINIAKLELENWLSDIRELGQKPKKIEYTNTFYDEDDIKCYIFKYKKSLIGKWLLGIVSEAGTFSEMREYNKNTEIQEAKHIINLLKKIWKKQAKHIKEK